MEFSKGSVLHWYMDCGGSSGGGDSVGIGGYSYEAVCEQVYITHMR